MKLLHLLCVTAVISAKMEVKYESKCDGIDVRGKYHKNEILAIGLNRPYQLSYYKHKREIYFSYNVGNTDEDKFEIGYLEDNSTTEHIKQIPEVKNGFAIAIDEHNHIAYFGGSDGVYKSDLRKQKNSSVIEKYNIWDMFFKHHLYFITYPSQRLYKYTDHHIHSGHKNSSKCKPEHQTWIHEKIYQFAIDRDDDVFITNGTGLYMIKNGTEHRHLLKGEKIFRAITINNAGEAYFCGQNGIFVPIKSNYTLHRIAHVKNIFGLTFDSDDHIIYSNPHQIVKLVSSVCIEVKVPHVPLVPVPHIRT